MTTTNVTPATLVDAYGKLSGAGGDTLALAPGNYGDGDFWRRFTAPVTITAADPAHPPVFRSLGIKGGSNMVFAGLSVAFTPDAKTVTYSWATRVQEADHITFRDMKIIGGAAVVGLNEDGSGTDVGGNIIGRPTAYGILIQNASEVLIDGGEVASFFKGIFLNVTRKVTIQGVEVHGNRTTAIVGADNSDLTVDGCHLHTASPWNWGHGDHCDLLALWSNASQTTPNARVRIVNNRMEQLEGEAILGMWMMGSGNAPFTDVEISGNQIVVNNLQGILLTNTQRGVVKGNRLYRASPGDPGQSPAILLRENVTGLTLSGNLLGAPISDLSKGSNPATGNTVIDGDANIFKAGPPAPVPPVPTPTPAPTPQPAPAPPPAALPDIVVQLLPGQTVATSKPGKTYKPKPGQRAVFVAPR